MKQVIFEIENQLIDLWETWVDIQSEDQCTLYVVGNIFWKNDQKPTLTRRFTNNQSDGELHLEIKPGIIYLDGRVRELRYSIKMMDKKEFKIICIFAGDTIIKTLYVEEYID